jgi:ribosomal protein L22
MADEEKQPTPETEGEAPDAEAKAEATEEKAEEKAEEKRPRRRRRKKAEDAPAEEAKQVAAEAEAQSEAAEAEGEPEAEEEDATPADVDATAGDEDAEPADEPEAEEKPKRRRGASEVTAGRKRESAATPAPRTPEGAVAVRAHAKYVRTAPRKARLVIDHIRGKPVDQARAILINTPRAASRDVLKLLDSAIANAENNHELVADELVVGQAYVDEGPTLKRYRPRALGRATRIRKRTSHMTITLTTNEKNGG